MSHQTFTWEGAKHTPLFAQFWAPDLEPQAVMCLVHGHGEHSSRYDHVADFLNEHRIAVLAFDQRGHGKSGGKRGDTPSYETMLDDIALLLSKAKELCPECPQFLYGHSMGGNLVANFLLRRSSALQGAILSAPLFKVAFDPPKLDLFLARIMLRIYPAFTQATKLDSKAISRDPAEVEAYELDPLIHSMVSPRLSLSLLHNGQWALNNANLLKVPTLLMHGSADRLTLYAASKEFARRAGKVVDWHSWEGYYHEMHNEPEADRRLVLDTLMGWILRHL